LKQHKATVHRVAEDAIKLTPAEGTRIPPTRVMRQAVRPAPSSDEVSRQAIREALDSSTDDDDRVDAGFAALAAQRSLRKKRLSSLKGHAADAGELCRRLTESGKTKRLKDIGEAS
jgi:hypothetical protein